MFFGRLRGSGTLPATGRGEATRPTTDLSQESLPLGLLSADGGLAAYVVELPMVRKKQQAPLAFKNASKLGEWLEKHHGTATELWVRIFKSDTGVPSVTWNDCVIESIRVGWIDGQMKPFDDMSHLQRLTPRKVNSNWSVKNCRHATTLIAEGRMLPAGLAQVEAAKSDGRWDTAYAGFSGHDYSARLSRRFGGHA